MRLVIPYDGHEHLGLGYLAARLRTAGWDVATTPLILRDCIRGKRPGTGRERSGNMERVLAMRPDVVAMSVNSFQAEEYLALARGLNEHGIKIIAGGPHATAEPALTLELGQVDALVAGEADDVIVEALEYVLHPHGPVPPWLSTSAHEGLPAPPPRELDAIPVPAKDLFYRHAPFESRDYKILTSRGCAYRCSFCAHSSGTAMSDLRRRGIGSIIDELRVAHATYAPSSVYFLDDVFTYDAAWLGEFLASYKKHVALPFHAITHPRHLSGPVATLLAEAGCYALRIGVQSLTPAARRSLGRSESSEDVRDAIAAARSSKIRVEVDHMVNIPSEHLEDARRSVLFYNDHRPDIIKVYWLVHLPGTRWFDRAARDGAIDAKTVENIRRGIAGGAHSYLFASDDGPVSRGWLGIHVLLGYVPFLPRVVVRWLVRYKIDRFLRFRSFLVAVGIPRLLSILHGGDRVGEMHVLRLWRRPG